MNERESEGEKERERGCGRKVGTNCGRIGGKEVLERRDRNSGDKAELKANETEGEFDRREAERCRFFFFF